MGFINCIILDDRKGLKTPHAGTTYFFLLPDIADTFTDKGKQAPKHRNQSLILENICNQRTKTEISLR
ncbi:hypothetical protein CRN84_25695 [Budvicia aquatica]|uniref:Uncharacterized protein n=1 Tax=Budvicia aquatica TaxID=82979 RepID=A0A2C6DUE4_9GAMM|nr:hypothetical protein CRN84_25695 [Budvicia aquatica]